MKLRADQLEAFRDESRPVLVTGPAGSGKTTVLLEQFRRVLRDGRATPERILYIAPSDRLAEGVMEELLPDFPDGFGEVWVFGPTAFAKRILREHYTLVPGVYPNVQVLAGLEELMVVEQVLTSRGGMRLEVFEKARRVPGFVEEVVNALDFLKQSPDRLEKLRGAKDGKARDLLTIAQAYAAALKANNLVDFRDLTARCLELFQLHPELLEEYRKRFLCVFVDDYQDLDPQQARLLAMVAGSLSGTGPRATIARVAWIAGDDSEAVFGFRGADATTAMGEFERALNPRVVRLNPGGDHASGGAARARVEIVEAESEWAEARAVARMAARACREDGRRPGEVAVLVRSLDRSIGYLEEAFRLVGVPYEVAGGFGLFRSPAVARLMAVLRVAASPEGKAEDADVAEAASSPARSIHPAEMRRTWNAAQRQRVPLERLLKGLVARDPDRAGDTRTFLAGVTRMRRLAERIPAEQAAYRAALEFGFLEEAARDPETAAVMGSFFELVERFQRVAGWLGEGPLGLAEFLSRLGHVLLAYGREEQARRPDAGERVGIMTIQEARGRFFPVVLLPGLTRGRFPRDPALPPFLSEEEWRALGIIPRDPAEQADEEGRLFQFAVSRATSKTVLLHPVRDTSGGELARSEFLAGLIQNGTPSRAAAEAAGGVLDSHDLAEQLLRSPDPPREEALKRDAPELYTMLTRVRAPYEIHALLDPVELPPGFRLSATSLGQYATCPLRFFYAAVLRVSRLPGPPALFGRLVHRVLEEFHRQHRFPVSLQDEQVGKELEDWIDRVWKEEGGQFSTRYEAEVYRLRAQEILSRYLREARDRDGVEEIQPQEETVVWDLDGKPVAAKFDRVDRLVTGGVEVVEYKTGRSTPAKGETIWSHALEQKEFQAPVYLLAAREGCGLKAVRFSLYRLGADIPDGGSLKATVTLDDPAGGGGGTAPKSEFVITEKDLAKARSGLAELAEQALSGRYPMAPRDGLRTCSACDYNGLCDRHWIR